MQKQQEQLQQFSKLLRDKDEEIKQLQDEISKSSLKEITKVEVKDENNFSNINSKLDKLIKLVENSKNENIKLEIN